MLFGLIVGVNKLLFGGNSDIRLWFLSDIAALLVWDFLRVDLLGSKISASIS